MGRVPLQGGDGGRRLRRRLAVSGRTQLANQEVEVLGGDDSDLVHTGRITPVHPASEGITTRTIRELVYRAFERLGPVDDPMPLDVVDGERLGSYDRALRDAPLPRGRRGPQPPRV